MHVDRTLYKDGIGRKRKEKCGPKTFFSFLSLHRPPVSFSFTLSRLIVSIDPSENFTFHFRTLLALELTVFLPN